MVAQVFNLCAPVEDQCHQELFGAFAREPLALLKQQGPWGGRLARLFQRATRYFRSSCLNFPDL